MADACHELGLHPVDLLAVADVANHGDVMDAIGQRDCTQGHVGSQRRSVLAAAGYLVKVSRFAIAQIYTPQVGRSLADWGLGGEEQANVAAEQLVLGIAEHPRARTVQGFDRTAGIEDEDAVHGCVEDGLSTARKVGHVVEGLFSHPHGAKRQDGRHGQEGRQRRDRRRS